MKYSYSPATGLQATPSAGSAHRPSYPTPAPQTAPTRPNTYTSPPPPQHNSFYNQSIPQSPPAQTRPSFQQQQQQNQSYRPQAFSPQSPQSPPGHQPRPSQSSGYTPVNYDSPYGGGVPPEQFYGSLIDYSGRPTEIFSRLCDAAFFWIDNNCDIPGLRGTGLIDPAKYAWMTSKFGGTPEACRLVQEFLPSFFEIASIPVRYVNTATGQVPAVDRRGWLHMSVFEARATPEDQHQQWNKALALWGLIDPLTHKPFPTPIPRSAFPAVAVPELLSRYTQWQTAAVISAQKARSDAMVQNIMNQAYAQYSRPSTYLGGAAAGLGGASYLNQGGGASALGGGGNGGGDHATVLDTVNTLGTLANTLIGGFAAVNGVGFN